MAMVKKIVHDLISFIFMGITILFITGETVHSQEHVWLHADGKYIKKSPACTDPNGIWMGCGVAFAQGSEPLTRAKADEFARWCKERHVNTVRIPFNSWGGPGWIPDFANAQECIDHFIGVTVEALKAQKIYTILDAHEFMCDWKMGVDDWMPSGPPFDVDNPSWQCQRWLDDWVYIADYYKDEPWVLGYELCNEPQGVPYDEAWKVRKNYMKCIEKIREVDTRHLVILGTVGNTHAFLMDDTWEKGLPKEKQYRPDPGYDQAVFAFHEYVKCENVYDQYNDWTEGKVNDMIGRIRNKFNVPVYMTESGAEETCHPATALEMRVFQQELIELCWGQANVWEDFPGPDPAYPPAGSPAGPGFMGWSIWYAYAGASASGWSDGCKYEDIWTWAAERQASPPPQSSGVGIDVDAGKNSPAPLPGLEVYPNPSNMHITINFDIAASLDVEIVVYDTLGRQVCFLAKKNYAAGSHRLVWDGRNDAGTEVVAGLYFIKMSTKEMTRTNKVLLVK